jgi:phenylacetate-CoA ligase
MSQQVTRLGDAPAGGDLDAAERISADELRELQTGRLSWTLRHAYANVPFYRKKFDLARVLPEDCRSPEDLAGFPVTTKDDLRDNYPAGMFAVPPDQIRRIHASSGTTGQPTVSGYTRDDIDTWAALMARSIRAAGGRPGDVVHVAYGYGLFTGGLGAHYGAERLGCTVIPASGGVTGRHVRLICDLRPRVIMVTPTCMLTILDEFARAGLAAGQRSAAADALAAQVRDNIGVRVTVSVGDPDTIERSAARCAASWTSGTPDPPAPGAGPDSAGAVSVRRGGHPRPAPARVPG